MTPRPLHAPARLAGLPLLRTQSDERLVDLMRAGNDGAFEAIVARYRRPLLRYCSGLLPEARAEDAVQQTFLRAYDGLRSSDAEMALRPWLYRIAHNVALNGLRDRSLRYEELPDGIDGVERPDQAFEKTQRLRDTVAAVGALPARQRDAVVLRELEGRSYEEIAAELGVTDGAVRQLLNRARGTLRAGLTAVTPFGLLARMPAGEGEISARVAELTTAGAAGAVLTKAAATALVTGAVVGGVASAPTGGTDESRAGERRGAPAAPERSASAVPTSRPPSALPDDRAGGGERSGRRVGESEDRPGPGGGSDSSGPGPGTRETDSGNSGPGSDSSGPGSDGSGSGSSGPGSGSDDSGSSGSGSSGSSGSGSGASGSDNSGSGSESSGSGSGRAIEADEDDSGG